MTSIFNINTNGNPKGAIDINGNPKGAINTNGDPKGAINTNGDHKRAINIIDNPKGVNNKRVCNLKSRLATKINLNKTLNICSAFNNCQTTDHIASFTLVLEDSVNNVALELATLKANVVNTLPNDIVIGRPTMAIEIYINTFVSTCNQREVRMGRWDRVTAIV